MKTKRGKTDGRKSKVGDIIFASKNTFYYFTKKGNSVVVDRRTGARTLEMGSEKTYRERRMSPITQKRIKELLK